MKKIAKIVGTAPQFIVEDVVKTAEYYKEVLGFRIIGYFSEPPVYAMVERDGFQIHFGKADRKAGTANENLRKDSTDLILWVPDIENFFAEMQAANATIVQGIVKRVYCREFILQDCDGHKLMICD